MDKSKEGFRFRKYLLNITISSFQTVSAKKAFQPLIP